MTGLGRICLFALALDVGLENWKTGTLKWSCPIFSSVLVKNGQRHLDRDSSCYFMWKHVFNMSFHDDSNVFTTYSSGSHHVSIRSSRLEKRGKF